RPIEVNPVVIIPPPQPPQYVSPEIEMEQHLSALEALASAAPGVVTAGMVARIRALGDQLGVAVQQQQPPPQPHVATQQQQPRQ
ncbi:unnamed protein product, partial [Rotaria sordida]